MPDPNNVALRRHGVVFMLLPKCANTAIKAALAAALGLDVPDMAVHRPGLFETVGKAEARTFPLRIAVVRDPLDRLASCWADKIMERSDGAFLGGLHRLGFRPDMAFEAFVERAAQIPDRACDGAGQHVRSMAWDLVDRDGIIPNKVLRFEHLADGWARLRASLAEIDLDLPPLRHVRRTSTRPDWTPRARALAARRYGDDLRLFGYGLRLKSELAR